MKNIKYYNKEITGFKEAINNNNITEKIPIYNLKSLEYKCKDNEFKYWLNIIQKSYGEYGEITWEDIQDIKTKEEIRAITINNLMIENKKKDIIISNMAQQINNLNIKLNQMEAK